MNAPLPDRRSEPEGQKVPDPNQVLLWVFIILILGVSSIVALGFQAVVKQLNRQFQDDSSSLRLFQPQVEQVETVQMATKGSLMPAPFPYIQS